MLADEERLVGMYRAVAGSPRRSWRPEREIRKLALLVALLPFWASAADLEVGGKAPAFKLHGVDGATYSLAEHAGKRGVVVAWFPKAFTPG